MNTKEYARQMKEQIKQAVQRQEQRQLEADVPAQVLRQALETHTAIFNKDDATLIEKIVQDKQADAELRAAAITRLGFGDDARVDLKALINMLGDANEAAAVKIQAVLKLEDAAFERADFNEYRPDYLSALRACLQSQDSDLLYTVLNVLSANQDASAQETLLKWVDDKKLSLIHI